MITICGTVSLIGVSWGGVVSILMAQMLEAENIPVSLSLLEGTPHVIQDWTRSLMQYGSINAKLVSNYFKIDNEVKIKLIFIVNKYKTLCNLGKYLGC